MRVIFTIQPEPLWARKELSKRSMGLDERFQIQMRLQQERLWSIAAYFFNDLLASRHRLPFILMCHLQGKL